LSGNDEFPPEFSRPYKIEDIAPGGSVLDLQAAEEERRALAERFGLIALENLVAHVKVSRGASGIPVRVRGRLEASVVQECVVSLEPIASEIKELIDVDYAPAAADSEEEVFSLDEPEPPEPLEGDSLELGELVAQHLSVALNPYPRKTGVEAPEWEADKAEQGENAAGSPFSVLAELRKKRP